MRPNKLLDLFSGAGGSAVGYHRAGFDVTGIDLAPMPNYPFEFHRVDALEYLAAHWAEFDAIHASPPCQASSNLTKGTNAGREYPQLIPAVRRALGRIADAGVPTVIENVQGSDLRRDLTLCGEMFGLGVIRHRYFEISVPVRSMPHVPHRGRVSGMRHGEWFTGPYFAVYGDGGGKGSIAQWQQAMGIDWTNVRKEIAEAIPPVYTTFIGTQLLAFIAAERVAS